MPYTNVPEALWGKMDSCVEKVQKQGHSKKSAIAICHTSVVGEKQAAIAGCLTHTELFEEGDKIVWVPCSAADCKSKAERILAIGQERLPYCTEHVGMAMDVVEKYGFKIDEVLGGNFLKVGGKIIHMELAEEPTEAEDKAKQTPAEYLADQQEKADAKHIQRYMIDPWKQSTMDTKDAMQLQILAAKTFGLQMKENISKHYDKDTLDWSLLYAMGALYEYTQAELLKKGYYREKTIPLYHPFIPGEGGPRSWNIGDVVRIYLNPLTSWSSNIKEAAEYAQFFASPGKPAYVLKTFLPSSSIISTPQTGFGEEGTGEVVAAGGEYTALVELRYE
jgi:hypothetical protein